MGDRSGGQVAEPEVESMTLRELLAVAYGNLAMAHYAVQRGDQSYSRTAYMIRARLTKGLRSGSMSLGSMFDDEKLKLRNGSRCSYCGGKGDLALDHLIPSKLGGLDTGDNLLPACRACNSSKGAKDLLVWYRERAMFPPLLPFRRYLKIMVALAEAAGVMDAAVDSDEVQRLPLAVNYIPTSRFPLPSLLRL